MTATAGSAHSLSLWADGQQAATLVYEPLDDRWVLDYEADWVNAEDAFPLSPSLPLESSALTQSAS